MTLTWWLQIIGLIIGFIGTVLMIYGGLGEFIKINHGRGLSNHSGPSVSMGIQYGSGNDLTAEFMLPSHPDWRIKSNYVGIVLLGIGFLFN